jgi:hypothetical protein
MKNPTQRLIYFLRNLPHYIVLINVIVFVSQEYLILFRAKCSYFIEIHSK